MSRHRTPVDSIQHAAGRARHAIGDRVRQARKAAGGAARSARSAAARPRTGAKRTLVSTIGQIPAYLRLLGGLLTDRRVSLVDKLLVAAAIAYIVTPVDLVPDFIPFLGEVDDVFLLVTALQRLIANAGRRVLLDHWSGARSELGDLNLHRVLDASAFFLPGGVRRRLQRMAER